MQKRPLIAAALTLAVAAALAVVQPPEGRRGGPERGEEVGSGSAAATDAVGRGTGGGDVTQPRNATETETADGGEPRSGQTASAAQRDLPAVAAAIALFASQAGLQPDQVQLRQVERVTWPDGALGCPQPGQFYAQMLVEGYRVALVGAGQEAEVHTDLRGRAVSCPGGGQAPLPAGQSDD